MSSHPPVQVLSSPDVALGRLTAHRDAAIRLATPADAATLRAAPLHLVDPAAGEGNYSEHLPDGMGRATALALVAAGWRALLAEPVPSTFKWLRRHFAAHEAAGRVMLREVGVTPAKAAAEVTMHSLAASVPELAAAYEDGVPPATRSRLQWSSSSDERIPRRASTDLWQARACGAVCAVCVCVCVCMPRGWCAGYSTCEHLPTSCSSAAPQLPPPCTPAHTLAPRTPP